MFMDNQLLLSLCIPTNGAVEWVLPVIDSIYSQGYDNSKFEVVITDNGHDSQLPQHIAQLSYPNLRYKQTKDEGFLNLVTCLQEGKGLFCKMINHRSVMLPGSIADMIAMVEQYNNLQPIVYCANGNAKIKGDSLECTNTDAFVKNLSYWCSWSAGIGFWKKDLPNISSVKLNVMFPNASLLFGVRQESQYVIWNKKYMKMEDDAGKGGYDLFKTFGVILLDILNDLRIRERISDTTFIKVKKELFLFLKRLYTNEVIAPTVHTFIIQNVGKSIEVYYGKLYYRLIVLDSLFRFPYYRLRKLLKKWLQKL